MSENFENDNLNAEPNNQVLPETDPQDDTQKTGSQDNPPDDNKGSDNESENKQNEKTNSEIYGSPEQFDYSSTVLPEGMELDQELVNEFEPVARKLNLSNQSANELMGLAVKLAQKNFSRLGDIGKQIEEQEKASYMQLLDSDPELNISDDTKYNQYLSVANQGLKATATSGFMNLIKKKGLTHHPEFIKTFHKIGELCSSDKLPEVNIPAGKEKLDAADILYGSKE